ncbi:hypothetical protein GCM10028805_26210 [Spirosoma harenae]
MRVLLLSFLFALTLSTGNAQITDHWNRLRRYAHAIGVDSLCDQPDSICLKRYFTQIIYGRAPHRMSYQGVRESIDTLRISQLARQFMVGSVGQEPSWELLLDSLESHDFRYRQLTAYCMRCLIDDYMADSLTLEQVQETLNTYRWLNRFRADKRILINIPSATLRVIDQQGNLLLSSRVIVGKPTTPTPLFSAHITGMVLYPYWNVPRSIALKELLPQIRRNPIPMLDALKLQVINNKGQVIDPETVNWSIPIQSFPYRLRQSTGCDNALGLLKFNVTNPYDIYLHDTNARRLFGQKNRLLSHGCIRVEKPTELANLLLGHGRFTNDFLASCPPNARPRPLQLVKAVPIFVTYNVLDIDDAGAIQVYQDGYRWWRFPL